MRVPAEAGLVPRARRNRDREAVHRHALRRAQKHCRCTELTRLADAERIRFGDYEVNKAENELEEALGDGVFDFCGHYAEAHHEPRQDAVYVGSGTRAVAL